MTSPLPPLPDSHPIDQIATVKVTLTSQCVYTEPQMHDFAKLAVREALERAIAPCTEIVNFFHGSENMHPLHIRERDTAKEIADAIRAMLKEYEE